MKGGYAGVNNRLSVTRYGRRSTGSGSQTQWHNGWTVGAGWEYGITRNWIVGLEYDYAPFEQKTYQLAGTGGGTYTFDAKPRDIQSAVVRLSYKFDGVPAAQVLIALHFVPIEKPRLARGFCHGDFPGLIRSPQPMIE